MTSDLFAGKESVCTEQQHPCAGIRLLVEPTEKDLGGFAVRRLLPSVGCKQVGPFVFFDHLGPVMFDPGRGIDVRPHPHIGLATVTYVLDGAIVHRDSLGAVQTIRPGAINLMTAGRGIVHSERTGPELRRQGHRLHALQFWVALPTEQEQCEPAFDHYSDDQLPLSERDGVALRLLIGSAYGLQSPVRTFSPTLAVEAVLDAGAQLTLPTDVAERAVYLVDGKVTLPGQDLAPHRLAVFEAGAPVTLTARTPTRLFLLGGASVGRRTVWWNLVASDRQLIELAKRDWRAGNFPNVPGETELIPLPE